MEVDDLKTPMFRSERTASSRAGGGGVLALEIGRGVPPASSELDPVPIRLAAQKTPCPNLEITTEFN